MEGLQYLAEAADDLGLWGILSIEHHFHSEGYEVGPSPGIVGHPSRGVDHKSQRRAAGLHDERPEPTPAWPREPAVIDQPGEGCGASWASSRGYQSRWTNVLGQHLGTRATLSPAGFTEERLAELSDAQLAQERENDQLNRDVFEEQVNLVLDA